MQASMELFYLSYCTGFVNAKILILKQITIGYKNQLNGQSWFC